MLAGGLRPLPGRLVTDSRSALGARRARPHATPFAQQHLKFHGPPNSGRSVAEWAPSLKKATGASRPSLQQRLPGAEGPPEGRSTAPRHAACGGPIPSSRGSTWKERKKERKQTTQGRDGRTVHRHHTGISRRGQCGASRHLPLGACLFLSLFAVCRRFSLQPWHATPRSSYSHRSPSRRCRPRE